VCGALRTACAVLGGIVVGCTPAATTPRDGTVLSTAVFEAGASRIQRGARPALPRPPTLEDGLDDPVPPVSIREGEAAGLYYLEATVGAVDPDAPLPLVVVLHGLGDRPHVLDAPYFGTPDPVRLIQPRAPRAFGEGYAWIPHRVAEGRTRTLAEHAAAAADRLGRFLDQVQRQRPTRGRPIVTGFSQGGIVAFTLAIRHPDQLGAVFPVSGWLPPPLWPREPVRGGARRLPIHAIHGDADPVVPVAPTRRAVTHLASIGFAVSLREVPGARHERTEAMDVLLHDRLSRAVRDEWRRPGALGLATPSPGGGVAAAPEPSAGGWPLPVTGPAR